MKKVVSRPCSGLKGAVDIPGDKSISHRALMFASLAQGESQIENLLEGHDCIATLQVMRALGVHIELSDGKWIVRGQGKFGFKEPISILDCKNSGTTMRLMTGLLSGMPFMTVLDGSIQLKTRPMDRVIVPLRHMGAQVYGRSNNTLGPLVTIPAQLKGVTHDLLVASAQVKSSLTLAALFADGETVINKMGQTRDHTERLLSFMGADVVTIDDSLIIKPLTKNLWPINFRVPGDISSAAFLLVAGVLLAHEGITLRNVGLNETRTGIIDALRHMGAQVTTSAEHIVANEPVGDIHVTYSKLSSAEFSGAHVVRMIDEIPVLALAATQARGKTVIKDAQELKVKESNRISKTVECLRALGANIEETTDGMEIFGPTKLTGGQVSSFGDHRLALFLIIAGLISQAEVVLSHAEVIDDSFPGYLNTLTKLKASVTEV